MNDRMKGECTFGTLEESWEQYSMVLRSNIDVIVQYGRLDVQQSNMVNMALVGYSELVGRQYTWMSERLLVMCSALHNGR